MWLEYVLTGCRIGFIKLTKEINPKIIGSHRIIHRQALGDKTACII